MEIEVNKKFETHIIENYENNMIDLTDYPTDDGMTARQLKEFFDGRTNKEVKDSINGIIGAILAPTAAEQIGAAGGTVQQELNNKVEKEEGKGLSSEDYTSEEKDKLSGIEKGAQVNKVNSVARKTGDVELFKSDVGLSNVDNTSDEDKPVSKAQRAEFLKKANAENPEFTGVIKIGNAELFVNEDGTLVIKSGEKFDPVQATYTSVPIELVLGSESGMAMLNGKEIYHEGNLLDLTRPGNYLGDVDKYNFMENTGLLKEVETKKLKVDGIEMYIDETGAFILKSPNVPREYPYTPVFGGTIKIYDGELYFNDRPVLREGFFTDPTSVNGVLTEIQKDYFMQNTGLNALLGDVEASLDGIIAIENALIGGEA